MAKINANLHRKMAIIDMKIGKKMAKILRLRRHAEYAPTSSENF